MADFGTDGAIELGEFVMSGWPFFTNWPSATRRDGQLTDRSAAQPPSGSALSWRGPQLAVKITTQNHPSGGLCSLGNLIE